MSETPEQRKQRLADAEAKLIKDLKTLAPNVEIQMSKYSAMLIYYTASVRQSKVVVEKQTRTLYYNDTAEKVLKDKYLTELDAKLAIAEVLPKAVDKFNNCLNALNQLKRDMGFYAGMNYEGDTHGIYNEYEYISFDMDGFSFQFER